MSLWWVKRDQLDKYQMELVEKLPLNGSYLVLGPPGSGKTNVLLRRAQFVRGQQMPSVMVLTFTRPLTEFVKTGCFDEEGRVIFPESLVSTVESWIRSLYAQHDATLPDDPGNLILWKQQLASGALGFRAQNKIPVWDALFVDEAQDLLPEEIQLFQQWSPVSFFVGDDRQRIYSAANGLDAVRKVIPPKNEKILSFHYRVAPEICRMADRIMVSQGGDTLASTAHYNGPVPARVHVQPRFLSEKRQLQMVTTVLKEQVRVYADLIKQGDRLGVIVARTEHRDLVFGHLENDPELQGKSKIIRARNSSVDLYDPSFDPERPICILTVQGCKGLEFRAVHWLFCDELRGYHNDQHYYTVITRAKTSIDIYYTRSLPPALARAHSAGGVGPW